MNRAESDSDVFEPVVAGEMGRAIVAIVGLALWAQLIFPGLGTEVGLTAPSPVVLAAYVAPPIVLIAGTYLSSVPILLFVFPLLLLPAVAFVPDADAASYFTAWSMGRIGATFAIYQALGSAWATTARVTTPTQRELLEEIDESVLPYRTHVLSRLPPFLLFWLVPTYGIFFDSAVVGTFNQSFGEAARIAQIFVSTSIFLAWAIVGYTSFIVPALNLEYDRRKLRRRYRAGSKFVDKRKAFFRLAGWVGGGTIVFLIIFFITG